MHHHDEGDLGGLLQPTRRPHAHRLSRCLPGETSVPDAQKITVQLSSQRSEVKGLTVPVTERCT